MLAVGDGRERFGSAFFVDGGSRYDPAETMTLG